MEVCVDPVGRRRSRVLDAFESRYTCIHEPLPPPAAAFASSDDNNKRYLTSLRVYGSREVEEPPQSSLPTSSSNLVVDQNGIDPKIIKEKVTAALKVLCFREPRVLVQFWSPVAVQKRCLLTTLDQPFGLGVVDEGLYKYRLESEQRVFVVDVEHREELGPPGRVYRQKLPEWSLDMHGLSTRQTVQDLAASHNIHGYINLPVFEPCSGRCVGVLELITSSKYTDYAFEVRQVSRALKEENLKSPNVFEDSSFYARVGDDKRQLELNEISWMLKTICDIHNLPLAQTWSLCRYNSVVASSGNLERSCSSFSRNCIGKVCMSTAALPFHVRDLSMWGFYETCRERHLDKSQGVVGRSLSSHGLCFCGDVSKLGEEEYPLHLNARMHGITSCLAIYLKSPEVDSEYVMELFLPTQSENEADLRSLVKTVKQQIKNTSRIQLGDMSSPHVIGGVPPTLNIEPPTLTEGDVPPELENLHLPAKNGNNDCVVGVACSKKESEFAHVEHMEEDKPSDSDSGGTNENVDINTGKRRGKYIDSSIEPIKRRKKTDRSISLEKISKHFGKTMEEAADSLHVSRSTLKRICKNHGMRRSPHSRTPNESDPLLKSDQSDAAVHASDRALTTLVLGTSNATTSNHDPATLTEHSKHASQLGLHRMKQKDLPDGHAKPETTFIEKHIIKCTAANTYMITLRYRENAVNFSFRLSDGLAQLEKLVATRFQLSPGSFRLKYEDEDGDMIWIACDDDLTASLNAFRQPDGETVIRLLVLPAGHNPNA